MNKIDKLKTRAKTIRSLKGKINGDVEDIDFKTTMSADDYFDLLLLEIKSKIKKLECRQPELDEDGIPYCKRKKSYPDWAKYEATDTDSIVNVHEDKPVPIISFGAWVNEEGRYLHVRTKKNPPKDWTKTLRRIRDKE